MTLSARRYNPWILGMTLNARSTISEYKVSLLERQVQLMDFRYHPKHERALSLDAGL